MIRDSYMRAMVLEQTGGRLVMKKIPIPLPGPGELLLKIQACGICRTDLHVLDGDLKPPRIPVIPGHQIVGTVKSCGKEVRTFHIGDVVGVPWLGGTCGECIYCISGQENLCDKAIFTGYQRNGGFAEYCTANENFCFSIPESYTAPHVTSLLRAGLIGYRALSMVGKGKRLGIYGFGAAAHSITQVALWDRREIFAFTREGDDAGQAFARNMGAIWSGSAMEQPPVELDGAIIFAPAGELIPDALRAVHKGGVVVCGGIHMSQIPRFSYDLLWGGRSIISVANLTRADSEDFPEPVPRILVNTEVEVFPLEHANRALDALRNGEIRGNGVLVP